jgi:N-acyl-D-amino-acid deacylase
MFDILIKDARIVDGSGGPSFEGSIGIKGERIAAVGDIPESQAATVFQANGLAVSPGFIDIHAHSEFTLLADPRGEGKVMQGVTTEVSGNCGLSAAPLYNEAFERRKGDLEELGLELSWNDLREYKKALAKKGTALNLATLIGHGNLRGSVVGYGNRKPTDEEMERMKVLLMDSMKAGGFGLSSGLIYPPGVYSNTEELIELARVVKEFGGFYSTHMRSEGDRLLEAVSEAIEIGEKARVPVQISHLKTGGERNWHKLEAAFELIEAARERGVDVTADRYPYTASSTDLDAILPPWAYEGGNEAEMRRLADPETRNRLASDILNQHPKEDYWETVMVASVSTEKNRGFEGKTMAEISREMKKEPCDALFDLLLEERLRATAIYFSMSEENLRRILRKDYAMIGSDSSARAVSGPTRVGKPHPRTFGSFPRVLSKFVREENVLTLEEAVRKMTSLPAHRLGIGERGIIRRGAFADLVVFNPERVHDTASYTEPYSYPMGIRHVIVNGTFVVRDGAHTGKLPGKFLTKGVD